MQIYEFGNKESSIVLIQPVDDHDLSVIDSEVTASRELTGIDFQLIAVKVDSWNHDLSPWSADAVFGNNRFGDGAEDTLKEILKLTEDRSKRYYIGGYSLAGLFSLWTTYQTDVFAGVAAASPSMWFPGFIEYMRNHDIRTECVYLSLGDKEEKTRNRIMATVGDCIREAYTIFQERKITCTLEWNKGNHFFEPDQRTARAFSWIMKADETCKHIQ